MTVMELHERDLLDRIGYTGPPIVRVAEAAKLVTVSPSWIHQRIKDPKVPTPWAIKRDGITRVVFAQFVAWLAGEPSTPQPSPETNQAGPPSEASTADSPTESAA